MSLMQIIADYDRKREAYIVCLQEEIKTLRAQLNEAQSMMMKDCGIREQLLLHSILNGAFDKKPEDSK